MTYSGDKDTVQSRVHVQFPGQVWNIHIDKLENGRKTIHTKYIVLWLCLMIGNLVILFNMAILFTHITVQVKYIVLIGIMFHCTANAGHGPRCTLLVTGVAI